MSHSAVPRLIQRDGESRRLPRVGYCLLVDPALLIDEKRRRRHVDTAMMRAGLGRLTRAVPRTGEIGGRGETLVPLGYLWHHTKSSATLQIHPDKSSTTSFLLQLDQHTAYSMPSGSAWTRQGGTPAGRSRPAPPESGRTTPRRGSTMRRSRTRQRRRR